MDFNLLKNSNISIDFIPEYVQISIDFIPEYVQTRTDDPNLFKLDVIEILNNK